MGIGFGGSLDTSAGDDDVENFGNNVTINAGDDFIDVEGGYNESDIIHIIGDTVKSTVTSVEDLVINFDTNSLTLKNVANVYATYLTGLYSTNILLNLKL